MLNQIKTKQILCQKTSNAIKYQPQLEATLILANSFAHTNGKTNCLSLILICSSNILLLRTTFEITCNFFQLALQIFLFTF